MRTFDPDQKLAIEVAKTGLFSAKNHEGRRHVSTDFFMAT
jgi:hypothetical protein